MVKASNQGRSSAGRGFLAGVGFVPSMDQRVARILRGNAFGERERSFASGPLAEHRTQLRQVLGVGVEGALADFLGERAHRGQLFVDLDVDGQLLREQRRRKPSRGLFHLVDGFCQLLGQDGFCRVGWRSQVGFFQEPREKGLDPFGVVPGVRRRQRLQRRSDPLVFGGQLATVAVQQTAPCRDEFLHVTAPQFLHHLFGGGRADHLAFGGLADHPIGLAIFHRSQCRHDRFDPAAARESTADHHRVAGHFLLRNAQRIPIEFGQGVGCCKQARVASRLVLGAAQFASRILDQHEILGEQPRTVTIGDFFGDAFGDLGQEFAFESGQCLAVTEVVAPRPDHRFGKAFFAFLVEAFRPAFAGGQQIHLQDAVDVLGVGGRIAHSVLQRAKLGLLQLERLDNKCHGHAVQMGFHLGEHVLAVETRGQKPRAPVVDLVGKLEHVGPYRHGRTHGFGVGPRCGFSGLQTRLPAVFQRRALDPSVERGPHQEHRQDDRRDKKRQGEDRRLHLLVRSQARKRRFLLQEGEERFQRGVAGRFRRRRRVERTHRGRATEGIGTYGRRILEQRGSEQQGAGVRTCWWRRERIGRSRRRGRHCRFA